MNTLYGKVPVETISKAGTMNKHGLLKSGVL